MPFGVKTQLQGPMWTSAGRAKLSPRQHELIAVVCGMCSEFYNALLESWQHQYRWHQSRHAYDSVAIQDVYGPERITGDLGTLYKQFTKMRNTDPGPADGGLSWGDINCGIGRGVINRFDKARSSFYDRCRRKKDGANIKAGYPRFKSRRSWRTITIPGPHQYMVQPPGEGGKWWKLKVKGLGHIKFHPYDSDRLADEITAGGRVQEIRIIVKPQRTEIHLAVRTVQPDPVPPADPEKAVGMDLGIARRVAISDGSSFDGVRVDRSEIVKCQRILSRHDNRHKKAGTSKHTPGRTRKVDALRKAHSRVKVQERHNLHRLVHLIVAGCVANGITGIAVENLNIKNMMKNRKLSDRIQQQRWGMLLQLLEAKAARAGIKLVRVNPRYTSLECSKCGIRKSKAELPLSTRVYKCDCGLILDRDVNAAINVLIRGFGERFRGRGGVSPLIWPEHAPLAGERPSGKTSNGNRADSTSASASSSSALPAEEQIKQYARLG